MKPFRQRARVRVRALLLLLLITGLLGVGAMVFRRVRERNTTEKVLAAARSALDRKDWPEACRQLELYLSKYPNDVARLSEYAEANLAVKPIAPSHIVAAIDASRRLLRHRSADPKIYRRLAKLYYLVHEYNEAAYICRQWLEVEPSRPAARLWLGRVLLAQHKDDRATEILESLIEAHPDQEQAYLLLSDLALQRTDYNASVAAISWLDRCLAEIPSAAAAYAHRARVLRVSGGDEQEAKADLDAADSLHPTDPAVLLLLADEWMAWDDLDRAAAELNAAERIEVSLLDDSELDPASYAFLKYRKSAALAMRRGDKKACFSLADRALAELPKPGRLSFSPTAVYLYLAAGRIEEAERVALSYREAVESREAPNLPTRAERDRTALLVAEVADAAGRLHDVIRLLQGVLSRNPEDSRVQELLASAYRHTGQRRRYLGLLEDWAAQRPTDGHAALRLAKAHRRRDRAATLSYARKAERLLGDDPEARLLRIEAEIATAPPSPDGQAILQRLTEELRTLQRDHPDRTAIHVLLAKAADRQGRRDQAIEELKRTIETSGPELSEELMLAELHRQAGTVEDAVRICRGAVEHHPKMAAPRIALSRALLASDHSDEAQKTLTEAAEQLEGSEKDAATAALVAYLLSADQRSAAIEVLQDIAAQKPDDLSSRLALLQFPELHHDAAQSQTLVEELKRIAGEAGLHWRFEQARIRLREGDWEQRQQEIADLLAYCLEHDPSWPAPALALGGMYEHLSDEERAEQVYRRLLETNSDAISVVDRLLGILIRGKRFSEAKAVLDRIAGKPPSLRMHRAQVAIGLKDTKTALAELESAVAADPTDARANMLLALMIGETGGDVDRALKCLATAEATTDERSSIQDLRAKLLRSAGRNDEALDLLNAQVREHDDFTAYLLRAKHCSAVGDFERAEEDLKKLTTLEGGAARAFLLLGRFYRERERTDAAITAWERGLKIEPDNPDIEINLARLLLASDSQQHRDRGETLVSELLAREPDHPAALLLHATTLLAGGDETAREQARQALERVLRMNPQALRAYAELLRIARAERHVEETDSLVTRALAVDPQNPLFLLVKAQIELEKGHTATARQLVATILDANPRDPRALSFMAPLEMDAGNIEAARARSDLAVQIAPADVTVQVIHALILERSNQRDSAIAALESYLGGEMSADRLPALLALTDLLLKSGNTAAAQERIHEAEALRPRSREVLSLRMRLLFELKDFDVLAKLLEEMGARQPADAPLLVAGAGLLSASHRSEHLAASMRVAERLIEAAPDNAARYELLAQIAYRAADYDTVIGAYRKLIELKPHHARSLNALAWILCENKNDPEAALAFADRGILFHPDDVHLLDTRGVVLTRLGRLEEARKDLQRCIQLADTVPGTKAQALMHLGHNWIQQGDTTKAKTYLDAAKKLDKKQQGLPAAARANLDALINSVGE